MLESSLRIANIYWCGDVFAPEVQTDDLDRLADSLAALRGQFSLARHRADGKIILVRDLYGINKLFFAVRHDGTVLAANYAWDLLEKGVAFNDIYSVPSGHFTIIDAAQRELVTKRYHDLAINPESDVPLSAMARDIRAALESWFQRLARRFEDRDICVCLSGGLDSSLIAALATRHFNSVTAYTYSFVEAGHEESEDAHYARRMAAHLGIPWNFVAASRQDILDATENALIYGQDWRDFNVHCAVVNELLGRFIASQSDGSSPPGRRLILTGDMMNEIVADYTPVSYRGQAYYSLPNLEFGRLRLVLIKGLDTGDREVGVFGHHGIDILQPYGLVLKEYLRIPSYHLSRDGAKSTLVREMASDLLPDFILEREKVRAQIGTSSEPTGILPILVDSGRDSDWLKKSWKERFEVESDAALNRFIRAGFYRVATSYPKKGDSKE